MKAAVHDTGTRLHVVHWKVEQTIWRECDVWDTLCSKGHAERDFRSIPDCWISKVQPGCGHSTEEHFEGPLQA